MAKKVPVAPLRAILAGLKVEPVASYARREIYWNDDGKSGLAFILVGYCPDTLPYFMGMLQDAVARYPDIDLQKVIFGKVSKSSTVQGFTLLQFPVRGPKRPIPGFTEYKTIDFGY